MTHTERDLWVHLQSPSGALNNWSDECFSPLPYALTPHGRGLISQPHPLFFREHGDGQESDVQPTQPNCCVTAEKWRINHISIQLACSQRRGDGPLLAKWNTAGGDDLGRPQRCSVMLEFYNKLPSHQCEHTEHSTPQISSAVVEHRVLHNSHQGHER